ncbi:MAG: VOC family protein, partial [Actinomycetota bacterium]|nr:VOC family protein [Actinomycetota bacterium]
MADDKPKLKLVTLVVQDMEAMVGFYDRLGLDIAAADPPWDALHRSTEDTVDTGLDLDAVSFAPRWNEGWPAGKTGEVVGFDLPTRDAVDTTYADLVAATGATGQQPPYDAFWGARYAVLTDPEGNSVGLMSP